MAKGERNVLSIIGFWAFIIGLVIAVAAGIMVAMGSIDLMPIIMIILIILGLLIGFLNITAKEILLFLLATIALIVIKGVFRPFGAVGAMLDNILVLVAILMAPAAIVAAIKALWAVGKPG